MGLGAEGNQDTLSEPCGLTTQMHNICVPLLVLLLLPPQVLVGHPDGAALGLVSERERERDRR